ncbi:MAG: DUF2784 domain-containing protein [Cyanobacteria bacterium J06648_11]
MLGYRLAADALLLLHVGFVLFVVVGLALVWIGAWRGWRWVRNLYFRVAHLLCIGVVVLQAWLGRICPLTTWEMALRERAGEATYDGAFIAHWLEALLYYDAPIWVFAVVYTAFATLVIASWVWIPPRRR